VPPLHTSPAAHAAPTFAPEQLPEAPQKVRLEVESMQVPPQLMSPDWQLRAHVPALHTWPVRHALPAEPAPPVPHPAVAPQYIREVVGSTHVPLQLMSPAWQLSAHKPLLQTCPLLHIAPVVPKDRVSQPATAPQ
jgi:hypothetical protein